MTSQRDKSEKSWFDFQQRRENYFFSEASRQFLGPIQSANKRLSRGLSPVIKLQLGREVIHLPPHTIEVKNVWSYTSAPAYNFIAHNRIDSSLL